MIEDIKKFKEEKDNEIIEVIDDETEVEKKR
jgi:hypothetical protein